jgi:F-type H+-transporting ATPase subunit epsilon
VVYYSDDVEMVGLKSAVGRIGILPHHERLMTMMLPGEMMVRKNGRDQFFAVGEGVTGEQVAIATDMAIEADRIDEAKVEEARQ